MSLKRTEKCGIMLYHVDVSRIGPWEMKRFIDKGYSNGYCIPMNHEIGQVIMQCKLALENDDMVWVYPPSFNSNNETIDEYMQKVDASVNKLVEAGVWDAVVGFHWDEPILNRQTNEDFYAMTRALSEKYGKRIFPVFSCYEITGYRGNDEDKYGYMQFKKFASEYITDVGFDSYGQDIRPEYAEAMKPKVEEFAKLFPEVTSGEAYYRFYTKKLKELMIGEPNIWYYPCAYICNTWTGDKTNEDYCIAHLEFFIKLLKEQEHPGGIHVYNWKTWYDYRPALDYFLDKDCPERWDRYEKALQEACKEINNMKLK